MDNKTEPIMLTPIPAKNKKATYGGIFLVFSGMISLFSWIYCLFLGTPFVEIEMYTLIVFAGLGMVFAIFSIIGGILAIEQKKWVFVMICGIFGILSLGFFISTILSLIAMLFVILSKKSFIK